MRKKQISISLLLIFFLILPMFSLAGCSAPKETVFNIDSYDLQITADSIFNEDTAGDFDLQITNGDCYISVMAYKQIDISDDLTPLDVYDMQNEALFTQRTAVNVIEEAKTQTSSQQVVTHTLYSAEKDSVKNYYATYLIELPDDETFAWVLVTAMPSYLEENKEYLHNIVCSLSSIK